MAIDEKGNAVLIGTIISAHDERPYIQISVGGNLMMQLSPEDTRELAMGLLASAESAIGDAFIYHFLKSAGDGVKTREALADFRKYREAKRWRDDPAI
jgi:hypothetical protein